MGDHHTGSEKCIQVVQGALLFWIKVMTVTPNTLAALIGSRICHDLVSPIGAINNGLELLELGGENVVSPEMELIRESVDAAMARIKLFRIAFGQSSPDQNVAQRDLQAILSDISRGGRIKMTWDAGNASRIQAQLAMLAIMCLEVALPRGGEIVVRQDATAWKISGTGPHIQIDSGLWDSLSGATSSILSPSKVQFVLLPALITEHDALLRVKNTPDTVSIEIDA
jgi:histidine phosphotransferase ChpT